MSLAEDLKAVVKGEVDASSAALEKASRDTSLFKVMPQVVVRPKDAADVSALVKLVSLKKQAGEDVSVTARAGGTDMSGGPLNDSIIVDTTGLNRVLTVEKTDGGGFGVTEPGVFYKDFDAETKKQDLELPSYTSSRNICMVGGMVANDSGGEKNLKYGKTARYVDELEVVLADGEMHTLKNLSGAELAAKLGEQSFEGELYRRISKLVKENASLIQAAKPHVSKNSSGYALWDIGDGEHSLNLARLFTGSQGTLGLITKIRFKLIRPKKYSAMTIIFLKTWAELATVVPDGLKDEPDSFESYDEHTFTLAVKYFPELAVQMKAGIVSIGLSFIPELWMLLTGGIPKLVLMAEFRADTQEEALKKAEALAERVKKDTPTASVRIAKNQEATKKYWAIRRESFNLLRKKVRGMRTAPFIDDFVVPPSSMPEFLPKLTKILSEYDMFYTIAGHIGDGNFHIIPLVDLKRPDMLNIIDRLSHQVYDLVISYQGSITGEHNDGLVRTPYVKQMFGPEMYKLFEEVKRAFDPLNIFNPGKKVGTDFAAAAKYLDVAA